MDKLANQLQQYATGAGKGCQHPINAVDDDNYCYQCHTQLPVSRLFPVE